MEDINPQIIIASAVIAAAFIGGFVAFFGKIIINSFERYKENKNTRENRKITLYMPLLRCLYELDDRFNRILNNLDTDWLNVEYLDSIKKKEGFAKNQKQKGYFVLSS